MKAIVTIKLPRNPEHRPMDKKIGKCPVSGMTCTDITGEHHSIIVEGTNLEDIWLMASKRYGHVTRVELLKELVA